MDKEALKISLSALHPGIALVEGGEWLQADVESAQWLPLAQGLRYREELLFDYLFCLTCVDWKTHLGVVYHLESTVYRHTLVVKSKLERDQPLIESVAAIWKTAEFHEREVFELFGVEFAHHPDLRKLILPDDWVGYPLRKDYEDPVNMIKL